MGRGFSKDRIARPKAVSDQSHRQDQTVDETLAALTTMGLVAVPVKPTMEQIIAATTAAGVTVDEAWRVYAAMLKAAET